MRQDFGFTSLGELDNGKVGIAFNALVKEVSKDIADRPHDKTTRKITVVLELRPDPDKESGAGDRANMEISLHANVPKRRTRQFAVGIKPSGSMFFNPDSPDDPHQGTLDEAAQRGSRSA